MNGHEQTTRASEFLAPEYVLYFVRCKRESGKEGDRSAERGRESLSGLGRVTGRQLPFRVVEV